MTSEMMPDNRLTMEELREMFGPTMPMEAALLLATDNLMPIDTVREKLKEIAAVTRPAPAGELAALAKKLEG